jgi:uncharacterized protein
MQWHSHDTPAAFLDAARDLTARAAVNQLPLGIVASELLEPNRHPEVRRFTITGPDGRGLGAAVQTPPWPVSLSEMEPATAAFVAQRLLAQHPDVSGVTGPTEASHTFAGAAIALTGAEGPRVITRLGVWVLHEVATVPIPAGSPRVALPADAALIQPWAQAFRDEAAPADPPPTPLAGSRYGGSGRAWLWQVGDTPVAFANFPREVGGYWSIGPVYTPLEHRGRGYATALVAHMSAHALAQGKRGCTLFTDLANPTSNAIYARVGFQREAVFTRLAWGKP